MLNIFYMKKCSSCKIEKHIDEFSKDKNKKDGLQYKCKLCNKEYFNKYYDNNKNYLLNKFKDYRNSNKEKRKEYCKKNKEKINENRRQYFKKRKQADSFFKFNCNVRNLITNSFRRGANQFRKNAKSEYILGCTIEEFKKHIEKKFTKGMSFDNYGEWHLDHIKPLALATTEEEVVNLNHYTNFQPLWAEDNFKKGAKYYSPTYLPTISTHIIYKKQ